MNLIRFFRSASRANWYMIIFMSTLSGLAGGAILAIINVGASVEGADAPAAGPKHLLVILFLLAIVIFVFTKRWSAMRTAEILEGLVSDLRMRICDKLRRTDLEVVEGLNRGQAFAAITQDASRIAQSGFVITNTGQQTVLLIAGMIYLMWLSTTAFWLFVVGAAISVFFIVGHRRSLMDALKRDAERQAELFSYLNHLLHGFKELKLNEEKSDEILGEISRVSEDSRQLRLQTSQFFVTSSLLVDLTLYLLLGSVIFILPQLIPTYSDVLVKASVAILFVFAPLATVVGALPQIANADDSLTHLYNLEEQLDQKLDVDELTVSSSVLPTLREFQTIHLENVTFAYPRTGSDRFSVGPINLKIELGKRHFIAGLNGSGKTTLLKLITGLYEPRDGRIKVNNVEIGRGDLPAYRSMFAGVFSDFHLFDRLYGLGEIDEDRAHELLLQMEISHKVKIENGRFSTLDLSTGQRKRLAFIASLLEDRQIYVFDEWTADQDPKFRWRFYNEIIPSLKKAKKTVIAITHDDRYWGKKFCDVRIGLKNGMIVPMKEVLGEMEDH